MSADTQGAKCFQGHWKEIVCQAEWAVFADLSGSCSLSRTGPRDGTLLEVGTAQSVLILSQILSPKFYLFIAFIFYKVLFFICFIFISYFVSAQGT